MCHTSPVCHLSHVSIAVYVYLCILINGSHLIQLVSHTLSLLLLLLLSTSFAHSLSHSSTMMALVPKLPQSSSSPPRLPRVLQLSLLVLILSVSVATVTAASASTESVAAVDRANAHSVVDSKIPATDERSVALSLATTATAATPTADRSSMSNSDSGSDSHDSPSCPHSSLSCAYDCNCRNERSCTAIACFRRRCMWDSTNKCCRHKCEANTYLDTNGLCVACPPNTQSDEGAGESHTNTLATHAEYNRDSETAHAHRLI